MEGTIRREAELEVAGGGGWGGVGWGGELDAH